MRWLLDEGGCEVGMVRGFVPRGMVGEEGNVVGVLEVLVGRGWGVNDEGER